VASFLDGVSNGIGYSLVLLAVATFREILGAGTWAGWHVIRPEHTRPGISTRPDAAGARRVYRAGPVDLGAANFDQTF
jgi:Na+-transporting NADH:ubiquinone oxidoreductase subunit NqrD